MLVFIIPLKSKQVSQSWSRLSQLFTRCLQSVCNQTNPNFRVVVACHERPDIQFIHPQIDYVEVDFPAPDRNSADFGEVAGSGDTDKAKKILAGLNFAKQFAPSHVMVVDADDCVSNQLAALVDNNSQCNGWYFKKGYVYEEGSKMLFLNTKNFNQSCGTSIIIKYSLYSLLFPSKYYYNHHDRLLKNGVVLQELPFPGAIYIIKNGENQFMTVNKTQDLQKQENWLLFLIKKVLKYRPLPIANNIRRNFGLYSI